MRKLLSILVIIGLVALLPQPAQAKEKRDITGTLIAVGAVVFIGSIALTLLDQKQGVDHSRGYEWQHHSYRSGYIATAMIGFGVLCVGLNQYIGVAVGKDSVALTVRIGRQQ